MRNSAKATLVHHNPPWLCLAGFLLLGETLEDFVLSDVRDSQIAVLVGVTKRIRMKKSNGSCFTVMLDHELFDKSLPEEWLEWPTRIELAFTLTKGGGVTRDSYTRFKVESLYEATQFLFDPIYRRRYFRYSLKTDGFVPAYKYDAEWSLLRRGSTGGVRRRQREQRVEPWSYGADTTLLEIWRQPLTEYTFEGRIWLRTGGRTEKDAIRNWTNVARLMRQEHRSWQDP